MMKKIIRNSLLLKLLIFLMWSCTTGQSIIVEKVKVIPVDPYEEVPKMELLSDSLNYEISFQSSIDKYLLKMFFEERLVFEDSIYSRVHSLDANVVCSFDSKKLKSNEIQLKVLMTSLIDEKKTHSLEISLPAYYEKCLVKHSVLDLEKEVSEFEINEGFEFKGEYFNNYALVSFSKKREIK